MSDAAKWYVVHTYSGYEDKVAKTIAQVVNNRRLQEQVPEVKVPKEHTEVIEKDKRKEVEKKLFPGYVLVKMVLTDDTWYLVRNTRGVTGFVGPASKPVPLTDKEVAALGVERAKTLEIDLKPGDRVRISEGAMEGFIGEVKSINTDDLTVEIAVSMFGRETLTELNFSQLTKADDY
jgi:transcriptional antiterminator NusG